MKVNKVYMIGLVILISICVFATENEAGNVTESNDGSILSLSTEEDLTEPEGNTGNEIHQVERCNSTHPCQNGGKCIQNYCKCLNGTSGDLCKIVDDCLDNKCGSTRNADCLYNVSSEEAYCKCNITGFDYFDEDEKRCKECNCGFDGIGCSYVEGNKECICPHLYEPQFGICTQCNCGEEGIGCEYENGHKKCICLNLYADRLGKCTPCDCGRNGNCSFAYKEKNCKCNEGYTDDRGTCKVCNCGNNGYCWYVDGKKVCMCNLGYREFQGTCRACDCGLDGKCEFNARGDKVCTCFNYGFALKFGKCTPCSCGSGIFDANCTFSAIGIKRCECPIGYAEVDKECRDIDECMSEINPCMMDAICVNTVGSFRCDCPLGFQNFHSSEPETNICNEAPRPWRTASIAIGCLAGVIIAGILIAIFRMKCGI